MHTIFIASDTDIKNLTVYCKQGRITPAQAVPISSRTISTPFLKSSSAPALPLLALWIATERCGYFFLCLLSHEYKRRHPSDLPIALICGRNFSRLQAGSTCVLVLSYVPLCPSALQLYKMHQILFLSTFPHPAQLQGGEHKFH